MSVPVIIVIGVLIFSAYLVAMSMVRAKTKALAYYRECGDLWRAEATKPWHLRDYGKIYEYITDHPAVRDKLMKQYFSGKVLSEDFDLYRLACQRVRDRDNIAAAFSMIVQWKSVPIYEAEVNRLVSKLDYFFLPATRMTSVLRRLDVSTFIDNIQTPGYIASMRQFIRELIETWEAAEASFAEGNFKTAYGYYMLADKTEEWMRLFRESLIFTAVVEGGNSDNYRTLLDIYTRYFDVLPDVKRGVRQVSIRNTDCIIAKCFATYDGNGYNVGLLRNELTETLNYLVEHEANWGDALALSDVFRYMKAYSAEQTVLLAMQKQRVPMGDVYERRLQNLLGGSVEEKEEVPHVESAEVPPIEDDGASPVESDEAPSSESDEVPFIEGDEQEFDNGDLSYAEED